MYLILFKSLSFPPPSLIRMAPSCQALGESPELSYRGLCHDRVAPRAGPVTLIETLGARPRLQLEARNCRKTVLSFSWALNQTRTGTVVVAGRQLWPVGTLGRVALA